MSFKITTKQSVPKESDCHLIPFTLKFDGPAKVSTYFTPVISTNNSLLNSSFRGKPLTGKKVELPTGYSGLILEPKGSGSSNRLKAVGSFKEVTYWKWDQNPSDSDNIPQSLKWLQVASTIHKKKAVKE